MKEFHLWFNAAYDLRTTIHTYGLVETAIKKGRPIIHTTQVECITMRLIEQGYRIFVHCEDYSVFEITLGDCDRTDREIRMGHKISHMLIAGGFEGVLNEEY
jgi:hypothetical protein